MKHRLISLMAILLLVAILAGCVADNTQSTDPVSSGDTSSDQTSSGDNSSEGSSDDTSSDDVSADTSPSTYYTAVSLGKPYTTTPKPSDTYPDSYGTELTDGVLAPNSGYGNTEACGFTANVEIVIDLGDEGKKLNRVTVEYLATHDAGLGPLTTGVVFGSNDGKNFDRIGAVIIPPYEDNTVQTAYLDFTAKYDYRYIKLACIKSSAWLFLSEVTVYADVAPDAYDDTMQKIEQIFKENGISNADRISAIQAAASGAKLDRTLIETLISEGKSYTILNAVYDDRARDTTKKMLTDGGATGSTFDMECWVGLDASRDNEINLSLGSSAKDASRFALYAYSRPNINVTLPAYVDVYVGKSKKEMYFVGRSYAASVSDGNFAYDISLSCCVNAQYVKFAFPASDNGGYYWFEEAAVYAYRAPDEDKEGMVYDTLVLPNVKKDEYWSSSSSDYNKNQNLLLGLPQQIVSAQALPKREYGGTNQNTPADNTWLTDGKKATSLQCYVGDWFHFYVGGGRTVIYDLGKISAVNSYSLSFLQYPSYAIEIPRVVKVLLSKDAKTWYVADSKSLEGTSEDKSVLYEGEFAKSYEARFVAIYFEMRTGHCFADEFEIYGTKNASKATALADSGLKTMAVSAPDDSGYQAPSKDLLGGVHDVMLIYHNSPNHVYDKDFFMPYVAYLDQKGNIVDDMYDGYLFLPTVSGMVRGTPTSENYKVDWDSLYDAMFKKGYGLDALEAAAADTAAALGRKDFKVKFYPTLVYLSPKVTDFGDIDGDGVTESLATLEGRLKVAKWYIERVTEEFESRNYEHIDLCGWYWFQEAMVASEDYETVPAIAEYLHDNGTQFFWIPYYLASGYGSWKSLGFDVCCMQPNYAFNTSVSAERLEQAAEIIQLYGMCLEMEIDDKALIDSRYLSKYMGYLGGGITYGYMNDCIRMYYQGVYVLGTAARSDKAELRLAYDYTYQFIKGTLKGPDKPDDMTITAKQGEVYVGKLGEYDVRQIYKLAVSAEHGSVTICEDGTVYYYPDEGYTGKDTFSFMLGNRVAWSEYCTVTVEIEG